MMRKHFRGLQIAAIPNSRGVVIWRRHQNITMVGRKPNPFDRVIVSLYAPVIFHHFQLTIPYLVIWIFTISSKQGDEVFRKSQPLMWPSTPPVAIALRSYFDQSHVKASGTWVFILTTGWPGFVLFHMHNVVSPKALKS